MIDTPKELHSALQKTSDFVEVTSSLYWYFLEVLPPRKMGPNYFIFQEGDGARLSFCKLNNRYFCYLLSDYLVTEDWGIQAEVSRSDINKPFKVLFIFTDNASSYAPDRFLEFVGKEFESVSALADAMNVTFRV